MDRDTIAKWRRPFWSASFRANTSGLSRGEILNQRAILLFWDLLIGDRYRRQSALGADLDSLADIVSFGVAPAVLGFTLGMRGGWDMLILAYFVVCGISRLARFNVTAAALSDKRTGKVKYFEGTPIRTSVVIVGLLGVAFSQQAIDGDLWLGTLRLGPATLHPLTLLYAISGTAMISTVRIPKP